MSEALSYELRQQFIGNDALATCIEFFEYIGERDETFDALSEQQKSLRVLNKVFSDTMIFQKYIDFIRSSIDNNIFLKKEVFLYLCDYFSGVVINSIEDILLLPSLEDIEVDMQVHIIPQTNISYGDGLKESIRRSLYSNSRGEVIYFIDQQNSGNLVYSSQGGFHLVDDSGVIILHNKGEDILGKMKLEEVRLYKRLLAYLSGENTYLSPQDHSELLKYIEKKSDVSLNILKKSRVERKLVSIKLRFSLVSDIRLLEQKFHIYRDEILSVVGGTDIDDSDGPYSPPIELGARVGLIKLVP